MDLIFDLVDLPVITEAAREIEPPETFNLLDALLPLRVIDDVKYKIRRGTITRGVAQYRAFDAPTPIGRRAGTSTDVEQSLQPLGQMLGVGEQETLDLARLNGQNDDALIRQIYDDTRSNVEAIWRRLHIATGQLLSTGQWGMDQENGLTDVYQPDVPAENLNVVPDDLFSDEDADILGFMEQLADQYEANSDDGQRPGMFTVSRRVANAVRRNKQMTRVSKGALVSEVLPLTLDDVNANLDSYGFPGFQVDASKVNGQAVIPDDVLIATPANPADLGGRVMGLTAQAILLLNSNRVDLAREDAPGIIVTVWTENQPPSYYSAADAVGMPVLDRPDLLLTARVL